MTLRERIQTIQEHLKEGDYPNEASISRQIVEPILRDLGWPTDDAAIVKYEYSPDGTTKRVDIALFCKDRPLVFIEVKQQKHVDDGEKQLFEYAYHAGVPLAILTTGQDWRFYLPIAEGSYRDRQVYTLDISVRAVEESAERLKRYLLREEICSGRAKRIAEEDHKNRAKAQVIQETLPQAWQGMLSGCDDRLVEIIQERVGDMCGFRPDAAVVTRFIRDRSGDAVRTPVRTPTGSPAGKRPGPSPTSWSGRSIGKSSEGTGQKMVGFELYGSQHRARTAIATMEALYEEMIKRDPSFPDRFAALPRHGTKRRWLARDRNDLFPREHYPNGIPYAQRGFLRQLSSGHWFNNVGNDWHQGRIIKAICEVANIRPEDLRLLWED